MKRSGNLLSFFFFGIVSQWVLLILLARKLEVSLFYNFLSSGILFLTIRRLIERKAEKEVVIKRELRKYVARRGSAFRVAFGVVGAYCLVVTNINLGVDLEKIVFYGFFSVIFTEVFFEAFRESFNYYKLKRTVKKDTKNFSKSEISSLSLVKVKI